jgi:acyl transferase domain-containing protein/thioesterase domain-containing protein
MSSNHEGIAIIGMAGRFPGANNINEFWDNLIQGKEGIKFFTDKELEKFEPNYNQLKNNPNYIKARGIIDNVDMWDAKFFGYSPMEAIYTDPQQRIWLETVWHALEDASCDPFNYNGSIGVFAGSYLNTYLLNNVLRDPVKYENYIRSRTNENFQIYLGSDPSFIPSRTSYLFNLKGPAISVNTTCSTSLVAVAQACNSLSSFESDICLAGGICIINPQETGYLYQEGAIASSDGHCKPFDKNSKGTIFSNGVGVVVLKRLDDAVKDGNTVYAVIKGWALNNDGNQKIGYTAPSIVGQSEAISIAQSLANVHPDEISYIEAHGTATPLGDPIEIAALTNAFRLKTDKSQFCGIGSVKSNIGHLDVAAGVSGLIKIALSAYHKKIPATIHYNEPNPNIDFKNSPFFVVDKTIEWTENKPLIMGISSFGVGGTNAHLIVENFDQKKLTQNKVSNPQIIVVSAKSENSLKKSKENISLFCNENAETNHESIAYTLQNGRNPMALRSFAIWDASRELSAQNFTDGLSGSSNKQVVFMFPGQGAQYISMGKQLYNSSSYFKSIADSCFQIFNDETKFDLKSLLLSEPSEENEKLLAQTKWTQPALFIIEYSLAKLFEKNGIKPNYLIGHSIGEYAAASVSGVFDLKSALLIVIKRGELMQSMPNGSMLAVKTDEQKLQSFKSDLFEIAAVNSQTMCTISFKSDKAELVKQLFENESIGTITLNTSHAFHSNDFDPILDAFEKYVESFPRNAPQIPFISCLTGELISDEEATSGKYWASQLRNTVQFSKGIATLAQNSETIFLEVGPNTHLSGLVRQNDAIKNKSYIIQSIGKADNSNEYECFLKSLGNLWLRGIAIDFKQLYCNTPQFSRLPEYPFDRKKYWIDYFPSQNTKPDSNSTTHNTIEIETVTNIVAKSCLNEVKQLLSELSGYQIQEINEELNFSDFGFDSLFLARFAGSLGEIFNFSIEFRKLVYEYPNIKLLAGYIELNSPKYSKEKVQMPPASNKETYLKNFTPFQKEGNLEALTLVHGDDLNIYIPRYLGQTRPYYGFLHPSADGDRLKYSNVQEMANHYVEQLVKFKPNGPYLLGGFSYGGLLAYEMALQLEKMGHEVPYLFLLDCGTPEARIRYDNMNAKDIGKNLTPIIQNGIYFFTKYYYKIYYRSLRMIRDMYFLTHKKLPIEYRRAYVYDVYTTLSRKYKPGGHYKGKAVIFRASENTSDMKYLGWEKFIDNILELITVRGNHVTAIKNEDSIQLIQNKIDYYLKKYQEEK